VSLDLTLRMMLLRFVGETLSAIREAFSEIAEVNAYGSDEGLF